MSDALTHAEWTALWIFANHEARAGTTWLDDHDRSLGNFTTLANCPPRASALKVWHSADEQAPFRGAQLRRTRLPLQSVIRLTEFWERPFLRLNQAGRDAAALPPPRLEPLVTISFKAPSPLVDQIKQQAETEGGTITAFMHQAARERLARLGRTASLAQAMVD